jgi:hypothetical protein
LVVVVVKVGVFAVSAVGVAGAAEVVPSGVGLATVLAFAAAVADFVFLFGTGFGAVVAVPASGVVVVPLLDDGAVAGFVGFL